MKRKIGIKWVIMIFIIDILFFINDKCSSDTESSQLIYAANQLIGFSVKGTLVVNPLRTTPQNGHAI